ncbi:MULTISPECIES: hypothetical protein [Actinoalloteichus]|uniref:hypothetical protein n=1 Tax=Actinoalloteichus TaxID=65496 RepID=UPI0009514301|nr:MULTISPECIES: hypothetical protein [Actinoalloteichus]
MSGTDVHGRQVLVSLRAAGDLLGEPDRRLDSAATPYASEAMSTGPVDDGGAPTPPRRPDDSGADRPAPRFQPGPVSDPPPF